LAKLDIDVAEVKKLVELAETHNLAELTVGEGNLSITVKGPSAATAPAPAVVQAAVPAESVPPSPPQAPAKIPAPAPEIAGNIVDIVAPLVGVFYRTPAPDAPSFVEVGDVIEVGSEVGLIEAMKVFSPIPSEVAGEIVAIPAASGKLVQQGEVLVRVRVSE
jgi:acetyl-CoA carboxylase biotin carboxyl carrier protein